MEADFRKLISRAINFCRFQFRIQTERDQLRKHGVLYDNMLSSNESEYSFCIYKVISVLVNWYTDRDHVIFC